VRIVTAARTNLIAVEFWSLEFDAMVLSVRNEVRRVVGDLILVAKFVADVLERLIQIIHVIRVKRAAAGFLASS